MPAETHVEQGPLDREAILDLVRERLAEILEVEPSSINEGDSFVDDLDADSLALIELVEAIEEELAERTSGFRIDDEDLEDLKSVRDAVDYVHGRVGGDRGGALGGEQAGTGGDCGGLRSAHVAIGTLQEGGRLVGHSTSSPAMTSAMCRTSISDPLLRKPPERCIRQDMS